MKQLNFNNLMKLNLHLGHFQNGSLITPYLFGRRFKRYIFNLEKSITILRRCLLLIEQISKKKGEIWWIGTNTISKKILKDFKNHKLEYSNMKFFENSWNPGLITNQQVFKNISERFINKNIHFIRLNKTKTLTNKNFQKLDLSIFRQRKKGDRFKDFLNYVLQSEGNCKLPDLVIILNPKQNYTALLEAQKINIPTIIFLDSDLQFDKNSLTYLIPMNDDNLKGLSFCSNLLFQVFIKKFN